MLRTNIRQAKTEDLARIAEIEIFNYRLNFYPIFRNDEFYFQELQVPNLIQNYLQAEDVLDNTYVYDDGVVKGFIRLAGQEVKKLFVEPVLQGKGIGAELLAFAIKEKNVHFLWALEKNTRAIVFYKRHGFHITNDKKFEEDTEEYLVRLERYSKHIDFSSITACGECCVGCKKIENGICKGCIDSDGNCEEWAQSKGCPIHKCAKEHSVQFCGLCREFPCDWLIQKIYWRKNVIEELTALADLYRQQSLC